MSGVPSASRSNSPASAAPDSGDASSSADAAAWQGRWRGAVGGGRGRPRLWSGLHAAQHAESALRHQTAQHNTQAAHAGRRRRGAHRGGLAAERLRGRLLLLLRPACHHAACPRRGGLAAGGNKGLGAQHCLSHGGRWAAAGGGVLHGVATLRDPRGDRLCHREPPRSPPLAPATRHSPLASPAGARAPGAPSDWQCQTVWTGQAARRWIRHTFRLEDGGRAQHASLEGERGKAV